MNMALSLISAIAWTIVYIEAIRLGFKERTYAIPLVALGLNFAWEWIYTINGLMFSQQMQTVVNLVWALADSAILYTFFRFGRSEFPQYVNKTVFAVMGIGLLAVSFAVQGLFIVEFGTAGMQAARYSAFLQNLLMSGLFIAMFVARGGRRGQSLVIAVAKWIGTLAPTMLFGIVLDSPFILGIGLLCSVFDLVYIGLLIWARHAPEKAFALQQDRQNT